jgi:hypothetical protein
LTGAIAGVIALIVLAVVAMTLMRQRKRAAEINLDDKSWLRSPEPEPDPLIRHSPVMEFHVRGHEARVTFNVPLPDEDDDVLNDLLVDEAVEVIREKKHELPMADVTAVVALAGQDQPREVGRAKLPTPGELPPPVVTEMLNLSHVAKDPFESQFDTEKVTSLETKVQVPRDDLGPIREELRIPKGLERGLRARGVDPDTMGGPAFVVSLLQLFDYRVSPAGEPNSYMAIKGDSTTFIKTETHDPGTHPELEEGVIRRFMVEFGTSGADRGMLVTDKFGPFMVHDVERNDRRVRFITRERTQNFIDSMALG